MDTPDRSEGRRRRAQESLLRRISSVPLFAIGAWFAIRGEARFQLGGDDLSNRHPIHVDAHGLDAVAVGCVFVGLGLVNLALSLRGRARLGVFWAGAALLGAALADGLVNVARAVIAFFA